MYFNSYLYITEKQLPDGGFLCLHRLDKMNRIPKSCVKANMYALMFCVLGYGNDPRLGEAWSILNGKKNSDGKYMLDGTLIKSYLPKERVGKPGKWLTFYTLLSEKEKTECEPKPELHE